MNVAAAVGFLFLHMTKRVFFARFHLSEIEDTDEVFSLYEESHLYKCQTVVCTVIVTDLH